MSITLRFGFTADGNAADATSVTLRSADGVYGVKREDTDQVVVNALTAMTRVATGDYRYTFEPPAAGLLYSWVAEVVYAGATYHFEQLYQDSATAQARCVTAAQVREHLRITTDQATDAYLNQLIDAATDYAELQTSSTLLPRQHVESYAAGEGVHLIPRGPVISIDSVTDAKNTAVTGYTTRRVGRMLELTTPKVPTYPIAITYTAGYLQPADNVPPSIRHAILMHVGTLFEQRESVATGTTVAPVPHTLDAFYRLNGRNTGVG